MRRGSDHPQRADGCCLRCSWQCAGGRAFLVSRDPWFCLARLGGLTLATAFALSGVVSFVMHRHAGLVHVVAIERNQPVDETAFNALYGALADPLWK